MDPYKSQYLGSVSSEEFGDLGMDNLALANEMTDGEELASHFPHIRTQLEIIKEVRKIGDEVNLKSSFWEHRTQQGSMGKLVAMIPVEVYGMLVAACPDVDHNKRLFYAWLDAHPEYQAYSR